MTTKTPMKDLVVILPGILGSVLQKDGKDLWSVSGRSIAQVITSLGKSLQQLQLKQDDPNSTNLEDGIQATRIMADTHLIPGLWKIDGYTSTSRLITDNFDVVEGDIYNDPVDKAANFYHFPYDWRRDNRANARILQQVLEPRLQKWREWSGNRDAKIILLAHSMGGLVSRYYLEVLGGWPNCRALFTFGTPYRGSVDALNFLANGYKKAFIDLTEVMRSLTSVYQLMPIYSILQVGSESLRIAEVPNLPHINQDKAKDALAFHREIEAAVTSNRQQEKYHLSFATVPFVGVQQPTLQSAELKDGKISTSRELPTIMRGKNLEHLAEGDGTVPQISAFPIEFSDQDVLEIPSFMAEKHGSLQNQSDILLNLLNKLQIAQSSTGTIEDIRGRGKEESRSIQAAKGISLSLDDLYFNNEPITITAQIKNNSSFGKLKAKIDCVSAETKPIILDFETKGNQWQLKDDFTLEPGLYRIQVQTDNSGKDAPNAVHDLFEVANYE